MNIGEIKDYDITVKVRNNYLLAKMRARGYFTIAALSRACGVRQKKIGLFVNLAYAPFRSPPGKLGTRNMCWVKDALRLAKHFRCLPEDLFPPQHIRKSLPLNQASFEASFEDVGWLLNGAERLALPPDQHIETEELKTLLMKTVDSLTPREQTVLRMRFGLDGEPERSLKEVAEFFGVITERIRQIEAKALRKLRHPSRSRLLKEGTDKRPAPELMEDFDRKNWMPGGVFG